MKLTKKQIQKIFKDKEIVFWIDKYMNDWNEELPEFITDNRIICQAIDDYFADIEDNILYNLDNYNSWDWDIHSSFYNFYDFLSVLKEHYENNTDMEW